MMGVKNKAGHIRRAAHADGSPIKFVPNPGESLSFPSSNVWGFFC